MLAADVQKPDGNRALAETTKSNYSATIRTRDGFVKTDATLIAQLALAGHGVHCGACGGYTVSKWGYSYFAQDLAALRDFASRLGVRS
ncbi:hypothetical protein [Caenimonas sp. SL110]|uniref:hypothetical protein n=1 Tax=Caenimonas sp. SL110 TaxID=1450524 RepID=UPI0006538DE9|nr:hypothetical protein [Caenimonas sp. SL110]